MIRTTTTLSCQFKDNLGNNRSLSIDQPRTDLTKEEIQAFMEYAIEADIYHPNKDEVQSSLAFISGATITQRIVETIELS